MAAADISTSVLLLSNPSSRHEHPLPPRHTLTASKGWIPITRRVHVKQVVACNAIPVSIPAHVIPTAIFMRGVNTEQRPELLDFLRDEFWRLVTIGSRNEGDAIISFLADGLTLEPPTMCSCAVAHCRITSPNGLRCPARRRLYIPLVNSGVSCTLLVDNCNHKHPIAPEIAASRQMPFQLILAIGDDPTSASESSSDDLRPNNAVLKHCQGFRCSRRVACEPMPCTTLRSAGGVRRICPFPHVGEGWTEQYTGTQREEIC
uniref:Uncharacterized protein n=1 Tax=Mycena chlorophos TaxID=658473 RepID=A0ABQ0KUR7_MYCCL|nr:predicted protein [Mycena chlorophos]